MGFISDILGAQNHFQATAPVNGFQAAPVQLATNQVGGGIDQAMNASLAGNGQQQQFIDALRAQANGTGGPSPAQQMLQQSLAQNQNQAASTIASQRGINPGLAARLVAQNQASAGQQAAGQGALLRSQEQLNAQGLLGQALTAQRGQNIGLLGQLGGLQQGQNALNVQQSLGTQGLNAGVAEQNANLNLGAQQINAGVAGQNAQINGNIIGGVMNGVGGVLAHHAAGGPIPGQAPVAGDSPKNDTVPAMLSPGEIVIPRSVAQAEDAPEKAASFVRAIRRGNGSEAGPEGYGKVLAKTRELEKRLKLLEGGLMTGKESARIDRFTKGGR